MGLPRTPVVLQDPFSYLCWCMALPHTPVILQDPISYFMPGYFGDKYVVDGHVMHGPTSYLCWCMALPHI